MAKQDNELIISALRFLESFEHVFHHDWEYTNRFLSDSTMIREGKTFCDPGVDDLHDNWSARGVLLERYQKLKELTELKRADG